LRRRGLEEQGPVGSGGGQVWWQSQMRAECVAHEGGDVSQWVRWIEDAEVISGAVKVVPSAATTLAAVA